MAVFTPIKLSPQAIEMIEQLFVYGPTWDGNIISKDGRGELVQAGIAHHVNGWAWLSADGVAVAANWSMSDLRRRGHHRWVQKLRMS